MNFDLHITIDASPSNEKETKLYVLSLHSISTRVQCICVYLHTNIHHSAFDEATINPVSPVLSNSDSNETFAVVEVVDDMQNGCFIVCYNKKKAVQLAVIIVMFEYDVCTLHCITIITMSQLYCLKKLDVISLLFL